MRESVKPAAPPIAVSPDNPCPFLRAMVAEGYLGGHVVPLDKLSETIGEATGETGFQKFTARIKIYLVALGANGLGLSRMLRSIASGAVLDELRNGPLDKHGVGSRILDATAQVHEEEIERFATFGQECRNPAGGTERGVTADQINTFMQRNFERAKDRRWYDPFLMKGEWPVLLRVMGKGEGDARYLSVDEVRTLFVERRLPDRVTGRISNKAG